MTVPVPVLKEMQPIMSSAVVTQMPHQGAVYKVPCVAPCGIENSCREMLLLLSVHWELRWRRKVILRGVSNPPLGDWLGRAMAGRRLLLFISTDGKNVLKASELWSYACN